MSYSLVKAKYEACSIIGHSSESMMRYLGRVSLAESLGSVFMQHILKVAYPSANCKPKIGGTAAQRFAAPSQLLYTVYLW